jgi:predicted enzyme related to lactoylglutathione lyase
MQHSVKSIGQIAITVSHVESALLFYRDILGLSLLFSASPNLAFLSDGQLRIMLTTPQGAGVVGANSILYFTVDDIEATHTALLARGATPERAPKLAATLPDHQLWLGFVRDPDGNLVGLMEQKPLQKPLQ